MGRLVNSTSMGLLPHLFCCKVNKYTLLSWSETLLCEITWWWRRYSAKPWMIVLAETLYAGKANPHLIKCLFQKRQNAAPSITEVVVLCNQPATVWLITSRNDTISVTQCWSVRLAVGAFSGHHSWVSLDEWKFILLIPYINSILATMGNLFMGPLDINRRAWGKAE